MRCEHGSPSNNCLHQGGFRRRHPDDFLQSRPERSRRLDDQPWSSSYPWLAKGQGYVGTGSVLRWTLQRACRTAWPSKGCSSTTFCKLHAPKFTNQVTKVVSIGILANLCSISGRKRVHIIVSYLEQDCRHIIPDFMFSYYILHYVTVMSCARACTTLKTLRPTDRAVNPTARWAGGLVLWILYQMDYWIGAEDPTSNGPADRCRGS